MNLSFRAVLENNVQMEIKNSPYLPQPLLVKEGSPKVLPLNKGELEGVKKDKTFERYFRPSFFSFFTVVFFILSSCYSGLAFAQPDLVFEFEFSVEDLEISSVHSLDRINLAGCEVSEEVGMPEIPVRSVQIGLPPGTVVATWTVQPLAWQTIPQSFELVPVQPPRILSDPAPEEEFQLSYAGSFNPDKPYPAEVGMLMWQGYMDCQPVADFLIYPVRYLAGKKQVELCTHLKLTLGLGYDKGALRRPPGLLAGRGKDLLLNPAIVHSADIAKLYSSQVLPEGWYEYLIITSDALAPSFEPLAEWKTQKGVPAKILTKEEIQSYGFGGDLQAQIRTLIQYAANEWGTLWVLLGGDTNQVPERRAYAMDSENGANANAIPCDLYYADLDGTWNADGDGTYGEIDDNIDLYSDVYVGRAPVENVAETQTFVNKVLGYEKAPPVSYATSVLFFSQIEDRSPYTDSSESMELIDENYIPPRFDPITKLYESLGNETRDSVFAALQQGYHFVNHTGHAWVAQLSSGISGQWIRNADVDLLTNGNRLSIAYSTGCWPGAFDDNCIAEHFLNNPNGGGIATIFNSRYGWYAPGNPRFGYSDRFNQLYYKTLLVDDKHRLGEVLAHIKAFYAPRSRSENVYRWHQYMLNLMGDPEMPVWTREPEELTVICPETILAEQCPFGVIVRSGAEALSSARVCIQKDDEPDLYQVTETDNLGWAHFILNPASPGTLKFTVTAHNHLPYEGTIAIEEIDKYLIVSETQVSDGTSISSENNGDGLINPGEQIELSITLKNIGIDTIIPEDVLFTGSDPFVTILASESLFPDLPGGATAELSAPLVFSVSDTCPDLHVLDFVLTVAYFKGEEFSLPLSFQVNRSMLHFADAAYDDSGGNGNNLPEPGETIEITLTLSNEGSAFAENVMATVIPDASGWVELSDASAFFPVIPANGSLTQVSDTIRFTIDSECPAPSFLNLPLQIQTGSVTWTEYSLLLPIGSMGLSEDFESGAPGWTHDGYLDHWNLDSQRVHGGNQSAYSGDPNTRQYQNGMNAYYLSPYFTLPFNANLSFWRWYQVATYGSNGLYVEIEIGGEWQILDFIGSGGALGKLRELTSDWYEEEYDLSSYPAGIQTRVRFRFSSDGEPVEEGFYLDDILVESQGGPASTPEPTPTPSPTPTPEAPWFVSDSFPASGPELEWDFVYLQDEVIPMAPPCPGGDGYVYRVGDTYGRDTAFGGNSNAANYFVETYLYLPVDGVTSSYERLGLFLRGQDCGINDNGHRYAYALTMDTDDGHTRAGKFVDYSIQAFRDGVYSSAGWHKLRIEAMGNHLRFLIDDQLFYEATDTDYSHGQYGFSHQEEGSRNTYYYNRVDNFRAGSLPEIQDEPGIANWQSY